MATVIVHKNRLKKYLLILSIVFIIPTMGSQKQSTSQIIDKKIGQHKQQLFQLTAKKMALGGGGIQKYREYLETLKKEFKILVVSKVEYSDMQQKASRYDLYLKRREKIERNNDLKAFKWNYINSTESYFNVVQVLGDGYYLISTNISSAIVHIHAPLLNMVDNSRVPDIYVKKTGIFQYESVTGSTKTINSYVMMGFY